MDKSYRSNKNNMQDKQVLSFVLNVVSTLVLVLLIIIAVCILSLRSTSYGGLNIGIVQSESMVASGLNVGDAVSIQKADEYNIGDIIVFYRAVSQYDKSIEEADVRKSPIWIHHVIDVKTDGLGRKIYLTKGSSNFNDDTFYVPEDFVLGKGAKMPDGMSVFFRFISSTKGILFMVIMPCAVMLVYLTWRLVMLIFDNTESEQSRRLDCISELEQ